jgi:hypothetical protein
MITYLMVFLGLPLTSVACLATGLALRGSRPRWLLSVAMAPPLAMIVWALGMVIFSGGILWEPWALFVWLGSAVGGLTWAGQRTRNGHRLGSAPALLVLAMPVPAMAAICVLMVFYNPW